MSQPVSWTQGGALTPGTDSVFGSGSTLDEKDIVTITEAITQVCTALEKARSSDKDRKTLLYLGVGAGNPMGAWHNPSGSAQFDADAEQVSPPLIKDAVANGYFVIGLNFNVSTTAKPAELPVEAGIHLHVPAKFPIAETGAPKGVLLQLRNLAAMCDRVVVLNAISNHAYPALVMLALVHSKDQTIMAAGCVRSVYALSYAESREQVVTAPIMGGRITYTRNTGLTSMADVFPTLAQLEG